MITPTVRELPQRLEPVSPDPFLAGAPASTPPLTRLVRTAQSGDEQAWTTLIRHFEPAVERIARGFRLSPADVDDVVQNTWLKMFTALPSLQNPEALAGWLWTTARRESLRILQRHAGEVLVDEVRCDDEEPSVETYVAAAELRRAMRSALEALPERQRAVVCAAYSASAGAYVEIADRLAMPPGSVGPTIQRAMVRLRRDPRLSQLYRDGWT
jgi:RNA polymerase sigma factor (sigma-70 family)